MVVGKKGATFSDRAPLDSKLTLRCLELIVRPTPTAQRHAHSAKAKQHHCPSRRLRHRTRAELGKASNGVAASREIDPVSVIHVRVEVERT